MGKKGTGAGCGRGSLPKYRRHSSGRFAFVEIGGQRRRLPGGYDSAESRTAYYRLLTSIAQDATPTLPKGQVLVWHLCEQYLVWALGYYVDPSSKPANEYGHLKYAAQAMLALHRHTPVADFGPIALKEVRQAMVDGTWAVDAYGEARPWARAHCNRQVNRCRRIFKWGSENEMVPISVSESLKAVQPLRKGKTVAVESPPIRPVEPEHVDLLLPWLSPTLRAMVEIQRLTGMRSQSVCFMRPGDVLRDGVTVGAVGADEAGGNGNVWLYVPGFLELDPQHKTAWRNKTLIVALGPRCQELLLPFLLRPADKPLFSPLESEAWRQEQRSQNRKHPERDQRTRKQKPRRSRAVRDFYTSNSYWQALDYAFKRAERAGAKIPHWHPHQLRHSTATMIRAKYGIEASRVYLGHDDANTTAIYAERDLDLARRVASEIG